MSAVTPPAVIRRPNIWVKRTLPQYAFASRNVEGLGKVAFSLAGSRLLPVGVKVHFHRNGASEAEGTTLTLVMSLNDDLDIVWKPQRGGMQHYPLSKTVDAEISRAILATAVERLKTITEWAPDEGRLLAAYACTKKLQQITKSAARMKRRIQELSEMEAGGRKTDEKLEAAEDAVREKLTEHLATAERRVGVLRSLRDHLRSDRTPYVMPTENEPAQAPAP